MSLDVGESPRTVPRLSNRAAAVACLIWLAVLAAGFTVLGRYKSTPADQDRPPARWPAGSRISRSTDRPTLLLFAHPRCPCTQATISELGRLLASRPGRFSTYVVLVEPPGTPADWSATGLRDRAASLPGVTLWRDAEGREAARFRAQASGLTVLYDTGGRRLFSGGITASRGHEGDSFGRRRLLALLDGREADRDESPVFGCTLGVDVSPTIQAEAQETR